MKNLRVIIFFIPIILGLSSCGFESAQPWNDPVTADDLGITNKPVSAKLVEKIVNPYQDGEAEKLFLFEHKILVEKANRDSEKFVFKFFEFNQDDRSIKRTFIVIKTKDSIFQLNTEDRVKGTWGPSEDGSGLELTALNGEKWKIKTKNNSNSVLDYDYFDKNDELQQSGELSMKSNSKVLSINKTFSSSSCVRSAVKIGAKLFAEKTIANLSKPYDLMTLSDARYSLLISSLNRKLRLDLSGTSKNRMKNLAQTKMGQTSLSYSKGMLKVGIIADKVCAIYANSKTTECEAYLNQQGINSLTSLRTLKEILSRGNEDVLEAISIVQKMSIEEQKTMLTPIFESFYDEHNQIIDPKCAVTVYENALKTFLNLSDNGDVSFNSTGQLNATSEASSKCINNTTGKPFVSEIETRTKELIQQECVQ